MSSILLFGAGSEGKSYLQRLQMSEDDIRVAFIDNNPALRNTRIMDVPVFSPDDLTNLEFDAIVVTVASDTHKKEISEQLTALGINPKKTHLLSVQKDKIDTFALRGYWLYMFSHYVYENNIAGNVAECGVYQGDFARDVNKFFPDRTLYLFDTFEGFDNRDIAIEERINNPSFINGDFNKMVAKSHKDTSVETVLDKMPYREKVVVKKGYFPESAAGIDDKFCFVNLDMDLYEPMLNGLRFFWNKMTGAGVILMHDYFIDGLPGVKKALADFESELGCSLPKIPIGDFSSVAITKSN